MNFFFFFNFFLTLIHNYDQKQKKIDFNFKKYIELQVDNVAEKEINVFDETEHGEFAETEDDGGSLSLEFWSFLYLLAWLFWVLIHL